MEGVTTLTSQLHGVHVWDFHKSHVHVSNNLPCNFESFGNNIPGAIKEKSIFSYIWRIGSCGRCYHHNFKTTWCSCMGLS